jgi:hypothetical protein
MANDKGRAGSLTGWKEIEYLSDSKRNESLNANQTSIVAEDENRSKTTGTKKIADYQEDAKRLKPLNVKKQDEYIEGGIILGGGGGDHDWHWHKPFPMEPPVIIPADPGTIQA